MDWCVSFLKLFFHLAERFKHAFRLLVFYTAFYLK
jgi:hypothetical protein